MSRLVTTDVRTGDDRARAICQKRPQRSLDQPRWLSVPPLPTMMFQLTGLLFPIVRRNLKGKGSVCPNAERPLRPRQAQQVIKHAVLALSRAPVRRHSLLNQGSTPG
jgi:hypothetical protein